MAKKKVGDLGTKGGKGQEKSLKTRWNKAKPEWPQKRRKKAGPPK